MGKIAVIGAGIVGCSCALFLQRDGHEVTLLDPRPPGSGTSKGNAGIIAHSSFTPLATPAMLRDVPGMLLDPMSPLSLRWRYLPGLLPWLVRFALAARPARVGRTTAVLAGLAEHVHASHDIIIQQAGLGDLVRSGGWLKVAFARDRLEKGTEDDRRAYDRFGHAYRFLDRDECLEHEPALNPKVAAGLLLAGNRAVSDPERYTAGIAATVLARGGRHLAATVRGVDEVDGRVRTLLTDGGPVPVDGVVLAAGAFSRGLAARTGAPVPLVAERGYHLMLDHCRPSLNRPVYSLEGGFVLAPMAGGLRLTGGVELAGNAAPPDFRRIRRLLAPAQDLLPGLDPTVRAEWQGHRPSLPDSLPVIGAAPRRSNMWYAFGHQHIGLTLGPLTGRLVADLVAGRPPLVDLLPFAPRRRFF